MEDPFKKPQGKQENETNVGTLNAKIEFLEDKLDKKIAYLPEEEKEKIIRTLAKMREEVGRSVNMIDSRSLKIGLVKIIALIEEAIKMAKEKSGEA